MERQQNIRQAAIRRVGANFDFNGNPIAQNTSGGIIRATRSANYPCGHQAIPGVESCSCMAFQKDNQWLQTTGVLLRSLTA